MYSKILSLCFICLFIAACDKQKQPEVINKTVVNKTSVNKTIEVKTMPEKAIQKKTKPALNLSIDKISIDPQRNDEDIFNSNKEPTESHSEIFKTLSRDQAESNTKVSGEMYTNQEKIDNEEYLDSIDGVQINIERNFQLN